MPENPNRKTGERKGKEKNPAAVALGRLGGLKGGKARSKKLSPEQRASVSSKGGRARATKLSKRRQSEIGRQAVLARWAKAKARSAERE